MKPRVLGRIRIEILNLKEGFCNYNLASWLLFLVNYF